jgi:ABC-type glycerol-3-phosphate transport system permease component
MAGAGDHRPAGEAPAATPWWARRPITRKQLTELAAAAVLSCLAFVGLFPYLYMLETAFKSNSQFNRNEATPTLPFHFGNFATAWREVAPYLLSSIIVAACAMFGCILLGSVSGFVLARYHFPGRNVLFGLIALLLLVPNLASLIPLFVLMRDLGLLNSYPDLIIPQLTTQTVFSVVLMKTYIEQLPEELFDAADIDGATPARTYWSVTLPLARPIIATVALFSVISVWSDYFWPELTIVKNSLRTVPVGAQFFQGQLTTSYGPLFAGYLIASVPLLILFLALTKNFLAGIQGGLAVDR